MVKVEGARGTTVGRHVGVAPPPELRRLKLTAGVFGAVVVAGFLGYQLLEGMSALDSLYMTVITISTVGFREVADLEGPGKVLTMALIVTGVASVLYGAVTTAEFVVEGHLRRYIERRRMAGDISGLEDHVIVCGFGRVGRHLADVLWAEGAPFVVVENDEDKIEVLAELGYLHLFGDATEEVTLQEAGIDQARAVVACVNSDADNLLVTLTAKGLNPTAMVVARVKADENERKLLRAGADRVIAPTTIGGRLIAQILTRPVVSEFLEDIGVGGTDYTLEEIPVGADSELAGCSLRDARIRERFHATVLAVRHAGEVTLDTHPDADTPLVAGDVLVVMGSEVDVSAMRHQFTRS